MSAVTLRLPIGFLADHPTSGLAGYPARDFFAPSGTVVVAGFYGIVTRISGRPCSQGGTAGGAYGRSLYIVNRANGYARYLTHLDRLFVVEGTRVSPGTRLGTVCDSAVSGKPGTSHVHYGIKRP